MIKKFVCLLLAIIMTMGMSVMALADEDGMSEVTTITDFEEIVELVTEWGLSENPEDIAKIVICDMETQTGGENIPSPCGDFLNPGEYEFTETSHNIILGDLIGSVQYAYPGGTMEISTSRKTQCDCSGTLDLKVISAHVGFDVEETITLSATQNVEVPQGKSYVCNAYVRLEHWEYHVIEKDIWFDDDEGTVTIKKPIGVVFIVFK